MSYENLRSTKLLATHCAVCGRPLRDAVSVEAGIGPDCREKYGYDIASTAEVRARANQIVYLIADKQNGLTAIEGCRELLRLGFHQLAQKIACRILSVRILRDETRPGMLLVTTPFTEKAIAELRGVPGRRWNGETYVNEVPEASKKQLWNALRRAFPGTEILGPDGQFYVLPPYGAQPKEVAIAA